MKEFLKTILNGDDGLIRKIEFISDKKATVIISAMLGGLDNWVNVAFHLDGLKEFAVKQTPTSIFIVLSNGIAHVFKDNIHYIDFSPYSEFMENEDDFRQSDIYFAADKISYEVLPYKEDY